MNAYLASYFVHVTCIVLSGSFFLLRGYWMMTDSLLLDRKLVRIAPHVIDTVLLASAISLTVILQQYPGVNHWLTVKVVALLAYIGLGMFALRRGRTKGVRIAFFIAATTVFAFIVSVALTRSPFGIFSLLQAG